MIPKTISARRSDLGAVFSLGLLFMPLDLRFGGALLGPYPADKDDPWGAPTRSIRHKSRALSVFIRFKLHHEVRDCNA
ncbi:MAG: hypothetical protein EBX59_05365 [Betaproteobacteria bacterium]|nr:hypothetical protein [Betaproteobacteria bacterium]